MSIFTHYLALCVGTVFGYILAALMFTAKDSESAGRYR